MRIQAPTHLLSQNRKTRARCDILVIEPNSDTPLYCHVILNLNFSYFVTVAMAKIYVVVCACLVSGVQLSEFCKGYAKK
jgi:hypothetical protein